MSWKRAIKAIWLQSNETMVAKLVNHLHGSAQGFTVWDLTKHEIQKNVSYKHIVSTKFTILYHRNLVQVKAYINLRSAVIKRFGYEWLEWILETKSMMIMIMLSRFDCWCFLLGREIGSEMEWLMENSLFLLVTYWKSIHISKYTLNV